MTEMEWIECNNLELMLRRLRRRKTLNRKLRLFACTCCRRVWGNLTDPRSRNGIETSEMFADGLVDQGALQFAKDEAEAAFNEIVQAVSNQAIRRLEETYPHLRGHLRHSSEAVRWPAAEASTAASAASMATGLVEDSSYIEYAAFVAKAIGVYKAFCTSPLKWDASKVEIDFSDGIVADYEARGAAICEESQVQAKLLRCIIGNPFRRAKAVRTWLTWNDATVTKIAQSIYDERRFEDLPILADALEDAGCDNEEILRHCREPGEHARGCWVIDLLLGKN